MEIPNEINKRHASETSINSSYAATYFRNNPTIQIDTRSPLEKINELNFYLQGPSLDEKSRFKFLIQKKSLISLEYGENSQEYIASLIDIGSYYNQNSRPDSAQRHLQDAQNLASSVKIPKELQFRLVIELSDSLLATPVSNKVERIRIKSHVLELLKPFESYQPNDTILLYQRDLLIARAYSISESFETTLTQYKKAKTAIKLTDLRNSKQHALLYQEIGDYYYSNKLNGENYFSKATKIYELLGMKDEIEALELHKLQITALHSEQNISDSK